MKKQIFVSTPRNVPREHAYKAGVWAAASLEVPWAVERAHDMFEALHTEGTDTAGGFLMDEELHNDLIIVRERYGTFRKYARVVPMTRAAKRIGRRFSGLTAYALGEGATFTESTMSFNCIELDAKKFGVITRTSSELEEDAIAAFGDEIIGEIGYAFSVIEDKAGFIGDGSSTYAGIMGLTNALSAGSISTCASANAWTSITAADVNNWMGAALDEMRDPAIYCHRAFFEIVLARLALAVGSTFGPLYDGTGQLVFNNYPVRLSAALPSATATSTICAFFGDLGVSATLGDRRQVTISKSDVASVGGQGMWERDEIGIKGTERIDITINEIGTASAGGAIVALKTHS